MWQYCTHALNKSSMPIIRKRVCKTSWQKWAHTRPFGRCIQLQAGLHEKPAVSHDWASKSASNVVREGKMCHWAGRRRSCGKRAYGSARPGGQGNGSTGKVSGVIWPPSAAAMLISCLPKEQTGILTCGRMRSRSGHWIAKWPSMQQGTGSSPAMAQVSRGGAKVSGGQMWRTWR